jgi:autonomous glycyl radical cofactor GrcA
MAPKRKKPTGDQEQASSTNPDVNKRNRRVKFKEVDPAKVVARLQKSYDWLCQNDKDRTPGFEELLSKIVTFLDEAEDLQADGVVEFTDEVVEKLQACQGMCQMHQSYNNWCYGLSKWSTHQPVKQYHKTRLVPYDRHLSVPGGKTPSLYTSFVPRPDEVAYPPFVRLTPNRDHDWDLYFRQPQGLFLQRYFTTFYYHAKLFWEKKPGEVIDWETVPLFKSPGNPRAINYAEIENTTYEDYMSSTWQDLAHRPPKNESASAAEFEEFAVLRGYRRAALECVLNEYEGWENNFISTPWRRVVHPQPVKRSGFNHFQPLCLPQMYNKAHFGEKNRSVEQEPSPWVYWYNQWFQQIKFLSGWSRKTYNRCNWDNYKQIALPMNYMGPYSFSDKCVYDEHWLKMGRHLMTLQKNLEKICITRRRWLIQKIVEDIRQGEMGGPLPDEVMARSAIDALPNTDGQFRLVDEVDVAWLKFLCHPSATKGLAGLSHGKPEDTLTILLDHRIQLLTNDPLHNPFWVKDSSAKEEGRSVWRAEQIALEDLVPMLNLGGRDFFEVHWNNGVKTEMQRAARLSKGIRGVEPPNTLYQFTVKEAVKHCTKLAKMGRIE